ncbi:MAG: hypothetical protein BGN86_12570 [Caulobacterales bacterium 68-7]|nr:MAG: hypothetical protein BGN86_12570 [Caulobacterales bacterium 68-7]
MRDGAWDQAFVSFGGFGQNRRGKQVHVRTWTEEFAGLAEQEERLAGLGRFILGEDGDNTSPTYATPVHDVDLPEHDRSWFTVVPETEMRDRVSRITEKPCKPLVSFHPLIFLGNPGALGHLRDLGFQTFEDFFDERYDEETDPRRRFDMVYDQVLALVRADEADLARRSAQIAERLVHNARFGLTDLPRIFRKKRDYGLLRDILQA